MRRLYFILANLMLAMTVMAEGVDQGAALKKAQKFMPGKEFAVGKVPARARAKTPQGCDAYYVFNAKNNGGFVIVSGDDRTDEILCYSEHGHLDVDQVPENMKWWLDELARQIEALGTSLKAAPHRAPAPAIAPLIKSKWNQSGPYNYMCPDGNYVDYNEPGYNTENRCLTGCVATAMAQVMYYWKWPKTCPALDAYEIFEGKFLKVLPATTFKWDKMKDTYGRDETGESVDAVAELMRYCGQAVHMNYSPSASSAAVTATVLASVFQYSSNCRKLARDNYSISYWESMIYDELASQRPVLYEGSGNGGGHEFIVDGYDGAGLFHFNWGWGGSRDCYGVLSLADPYKAGDEKAFHLNQFAVIGVKPAEDGEVILPLMQGYFDETVPAVTYSRSSSADDFSNISLNGYMSARYTLEPNSSLDVEVGWGLFKDDEFLQLLDNKTVTIPARLSWTFYYDATVSFGAGLPDGQYELSHVYRLAGETEWKPCYYTENRMLYAEIAGNKLTLFVPNPKNKSFKVNNIATSDEPLIGEAISVKVNITNTGESKQEIIGLWIQKPGDQQWIKTSVNYCYVDPGKSTDVTTSFVPDVAGVYQLMITMGSSMDALATATVKVAGFEQIVVDGITYRCIPDYQRAAVINDSEERHDKSGDITILQKVTASGVDCLVTSIENRAFYNWGQITSVTIPEGVTSIGNEAFAYCWALEKVVLPSTVSNFGNYIFHYCNRLSAVCSYIQNPPAVSDNTFTTAMWNEETQQYDQSPSPAKLYVPIGTKAKYEAISGWTMFANIEEGELLETMVDGLRYSYCTGNGQATVIRDASYYEFTEVSIPATVSIDGKNYRVTAIGNKAFFGCGRLQSLTLPEGLETIGTNAFSYVSISEVTFPSKLKTIGEEAFFSCNGIRTLVIPEGVAVVGTYAFAYMYGMEKLELPTTLNEIGECAFLGCENLTAVVSHLINPPAVNDNTFALLIWNEETYDLIPSSATLYVPIGTKAKYEALSGWMWFAHIEEGELLEAMVDGLRYSYGTGGEKATVIQDASYQEFTGVSIPATVSIGGKNYRVTAIGNSAFIECRQLQSLTLPEGLETIGKKAFSYAPLSEVIFPTTLKFIGDNAFYNCNGIKNLVIPEGVTTIGTYAFAYMYGMAKLELPSTLKEIGAGVIQGCENLTTVVSHIISPPAVSDNTFASRKWNAETQQEDLIPSPATLYVPIGTKAQYEAIHGWTMFANIEEGEPVDLGIATTEQPHASDGRWYNLQGMPVDKPQKGVFIRNGRKVVVK